MPLGGSVVARTATLGQYVANSTGHSPSQQAAPSGQGQTGEPGPFPGGFRVSQRRGSRSW